MPESVAFNPEQRRRKDGEPPTIPDHELLRRIGGGSYGEVWLARNALGSLRAVKVVHRNSFDHDRPFEREFAGIQKFEPISRSHDGFVDLLQVGRNDAEGYFYYVMELADDAARESEQVGESESEKLRPTGRPSTTPAHSLTFSPAQYAPRTLRSEIQRRGRLPLEECVEIGIALASALAFLHKQGLVHRDIKPSNIIFVDGVPKLADVGLVADVNEARSFVGTEGFIPLEGPGTPQADLYSLGIVLYQMSTGKSHQDFPEPPEDLVSQPDHARWLEFNAVIHKACAADPRERYQSAEEMAAELSILRRGDSVRQARTRKRRAILMKGTAIAIAVASMAIAITATVGAKRNEEQRLRRQRAEAERVKGSRERETQTKEGFTRAIEHFNRAIEIDPTFALPHVNLVFAYRDAADWHLPARQAFSEARKAATRALAIDSSLAGAHVENAYVQWQYEWNWAAAAKSFQRAIALSPTNAYARSAYAGFLLALGRRSEASVELNEALRWNRREPLALNMLVVQLLLAGKHEEAIRIATQSLRTNSTDFIGEFRLAWTLQRAGRYEQAIEHIQIARSIDDGQDLLAMLGQTYAFMGNRVEAKRVIGELKQRAQNRYVSPVFLALVYAALRDRTQTLDWLEKGFSDRSAMLVSANISFGLLADPYWDSLRSEPRFQNLVDRIGFPNQGSITRGIDAAR